MTIEEMKRRKQELGYSNEQISQLSGVPLGTIIKIFGGTTKAPRRKTIEELERILTPEKKEDYSGLERTSYEVREEEVLYGTSPTKKCTVEDYYRLPNDVRAELINGKFFVMEAPSVNHQLALAEIAKQFMLCQAAHPGDCKVLFAPCDVQLDEDNYTMVQPDLLVVCDLARLHKKVCYGAPDLTLEIMSPSSRSHDSVRKLHKYKDAGVREYWIVDPENESVLVYDFGGDAEGTRFRLYSFTDRVPVGISGGLCEIDFAEVKRAML